MLNEFTSGLQSCSGPAGGSLHKWHGGAKATGNLLELCSESGKISLYFKERSDPPGFWSLNQNQLAAIQTAGVPWFVVLLVGAPDHGFVLSSDQVMKNMPSWSQSKADFKLHEGNEIHGSIEFTSFAALLAHVGPQS
jgi:hypothetical protein